MNSNTVSYLRFMENEQHETLRDFTYQAAVQTIILVNDRKRYTSVVDLWIYFSLILMSSFRDRSFKIHISSYGNVHISCHTERQQCTNLNCTQWFISWVRLHMRWLNCKQTYRNRELLNFKVIYRKMKESKRSGRGYFENLWKLIPESPRCKRDIGKNV